MDKPRINRLLLVDDEEGIRLVMSILLKDMGYTVNTAAQGDEALELYKKLRPDLVISDIKMPGKDGIELLKEIKTLDPDAEVLLLTGHGDMALAVAGLRHGAGDFLSKPVSDAAIEVALERAQKRIAMRAALRRHTEELEELVTKRTAELVQSERFAAVGESAADMAHAIKNISGALEGTMYVLEKGLELNQKEYFEQGWRMIRADVARLRNLALGLLNLGRKPVLDWRPAEPAAPARQACATLRTRAQSAGVRLEYTDEAGEESFVMPLEDVYQCLLNLAINGIEACGQDAAAHNADAPGAPRVNITVRRERLDSPCVSYFIEDNGPGMKMDETGADEGAFSSNKTGGSGIGIFATRRTAQAMGARLEFMQSNNGGTIAVLRLPEQKPC